MIILEGLIWFILAAAALFGLVLLLNLRVKIHGRWQDTAELLLTIGLGALYSDLRLALDGKSEVVIRAGNCVLSRKIMSPFKPQPKKREDKTSINEFRPFLRGEFLKRVIETVQTICSKVRDKELCIRGALGFSDPYYTGIFAACSSLVPGLEVEPVFSGSYRDLEFRIGGKLLLGTLACHLLKLLASREARVVWRSVKKAKKEKNLRKGATSWKRAVYSIVK